MSDAHWPRLLVIDDDESICELISRVARGLGYLCDTASTAEALDNLVGAGHDVTIVDLSLRGSDGINVMRNLANRDPGARIVIATGASDRIVASARRVAELYGLKVLGECRKPIAMETLRTVLGRGIASERAERHQVPATELESLVHDLDFAAIQVVYQPIMRGRDAVVVGAEALVRWEHPTLGPVPPSVFVPELERLSLSRHLLLQVARLVASDRRRHLALRELPSVSINVSTADLLHRTMPDELHAVLAQDLPAQAWTLEITETFADGMTVASLDAVTRLGIMEFNLAIDDYGTGSSHIERLRSYPFTNLKIDRSFVGMGQPPSESDWWIIESAISLGHHLGLEVTAEGVEDVGVFHRLRDLGCDHVQGYLIGHGLPAVQFQARFGDRLVSRSAAQLLGIA